MEENYDVLHVNRTSLLDRSFVQTPLSSRKPPFGRIMYAAKTITKETSKEHVRGYHAEILEQVAGGINNVTGFLLIFPTCCLHMLEATTETLMKVLRELQSNSSVVDSVCILSFTEEMEYRFFQGWMAGFINSPNMGPYDPHEESSLLAEISNLNINMLKWGKILSKMDKIQQVQALDSVRSTAEEYLPDDPAAIFSIILANGTPKLREFMELYDIRLKDIVFEKDLVWPMFEEPFRLV